ncbi:hypothetical protein H8959_007356, partial [Pygathrix nigripes]
ARGSVIGCETTARARIGCFGPGGPGPGDRIRPRTFKEGTPPPAGVGRPRRCDRPAGQTDWGQEPGARAQRHQGPPRAPRSTALGVPGGRRARVSPLAMGSAALEILGLVLCLVGWGGLILACGLPMWQVTAFLDHNIVTAQTTWKGLWMSCVVQSTGHMQCKVYDSVLALSTEVQAARALTVGAVLLAFVALFVTLAGAQCTTCVAPGPAKARVALTGGVLYLLCGLLALVPLCWFANIVVREFYDPSVPVSQKYELGAALYIGWAATALLMLPREVFGAAAAHGHRRLRQEELRLRALGTAGTLLPATSARRRMSLGSPAWTGGFRRVVPRAGSAERPALRPDAVPGSAPACARGWPSPATSRALPLTDGLGQFPFLYAALFLQAKRVSD